MSKPGEPGNVNGVAAPGGPRFQKGKSGNPGGRPSLWKDLEAAGVINPELAGLTPDQARAKWWAMILPVAFAGPKGPKDSNWAYAAQEVGVRLLGKAKETVVIEDNSTPSVDWSTVPPEKRERILAAIAELEVLAGVTEH